MLPEDLQMKAATIHAYGKPLVLEDIPAPQAGPGEVLVHVEGAGFCHSDIHVIDKKSIACTPTRRLCPLIRRNPKQHLLRNVDDEPGAFDRWNNVAAIDSQWLADL
jgi:hypothetical protein